VFGKAYALSKSGMAWSNGAARRRIWRGVSRDDGGGFIGGGEFDCA
jgi:hypothetical protein